MRVTLAENSNSALAALQGAIRDKDPYRLAIIDMQMPGMDGETLGRAIKADPHLSDTRMIVLTSLGVPGDAARFVGSGFAGYLTKPIRHLEMKAVISLVLAATGEALNSTWPITTRHTAREALNVRVNRKAHILVVEDNITNQQVALAILKKFGLRADAVANGAEAVAALESIPYDLVLMDIQMPVMGGYEAVSVIRNPKSKALNREVPIIALTARAIQEERDQCIKAGMNDYLPKPVSPQALVTMLEKWLPGETRKPIVLKPEGKAKGYTPASPAVFDKAALHSRLMGDEELVASILAGFIIDIPQQIKTLKELAAAGDMAGVEKKAHSIKGAAANIGGGALQALSAEIEAAAKQGYSAELSSLIDKVEGCFIQLVGEIRDGQ